MVLSSFNAIVPGSTIFDDIISGVSDFERGITGVVCNYFEGLPLKDNLYIAVRIRNGIPRDNGINCESHGQQQSSSRLTRRSNNLPGSRPDFLFRNTSPKSSYSLKDSGAYLVGDLKLYLGKVREILNNRGREKRQWEEMSSYARSYQMLPFVSYLALFDGNPIHDFDNNLSNPHGLSKSDKKRLAAEALRSGVILVLVNLVED